MEFCKLLLSKRVANIVVCLISWHVWRVLTDLSITHLRTSMHLRIRPAQTAPHVAPHRTRGPHLHCAKVWRHTVVSVHSCLGRRAAYCDCAPAGAVPPVLRCVCCCCCCRRRCCRFGTYGKQTFRGARFLVSFAARTWC